MAGLGDQTRKIWIRCNQPSLMPDIERLCDAILLEELPVDLLVTSSVSLSENAFFRSEPEIETALSPSNTRWSIKRFLNKHSPALILWVGSANELTSFAEIDRRGIPRLLMCASSEGLKFNRNNSLQSAVSKALRKFSLVTTCDLTLIDTLAASLPDTSRLIYHIPLTEGIPDSVPTNGAAARLDVAARPVWLAHDVPSQEIASIMRTHSQLTRRSHRLLLILTPRNEAVREEAIETCAALNFTVADLTRGEAVSESTQVLLGPEENGGPALFAASTITYCGGSMTVGSQCNPFTIAQSGSVIVHGPVHNAHQKAFARLRAYRATCPVLSPEGLFKQISTLLQADEAALIADRAWDLITSDAAVLENVMSAIRETIEPEAAA